MTWFKLLTEREAIQGLRYGIEIEIEGAGLTSHLSVMNRQRWISESDGSLRNGVEFKTVGAMSYTEALECIDDYSKYLELTHCTAGPRTSVHLHVNVQDLTDEQLKSFVWLSIAMEPVILKFCTELRNHNGYCVPVHKSTNLVDQWRYFLSNLGKRSTLHPAVRGFPKYAATGGYRLKDLGTIEFRMFPGCTYATKIIWYMDIIRAIYEQARHFTVQQLQDRKLSETPLALISDIIINNRKRITLHDLNESIEIGVRMANDIVRKPLTSDDIKAMHQTLFPSQYKAFNDNAIIELCKLTTRAEIKSFLSQFDPDDIKSVFKGQYETFHRLTQAGVPANTAFNISTVIVSL